MTRPAPANPRVALCHDWLTGMRGGERVLELLCRRYPDAPLVTLLHNPDAISAAINRHVTATSWFQYLPGVKDYYRRLLPLMPAAIGRLRAPPCDLLISTSHCVAKSLRPPPGARHLCYCFTPMRYAWLFHDEYFGRNPAKRALLWPLLAWLRRWDRRTAAGVDRFVAISRHVQDRIRRFYGRESGLVYPPVDCRRCAPDGRAVAGDYDLIVSALVPYKRVDLAVDAYARNGRRLLVVGVGGDRARLEARAPAQVRFLGWQSDEAVLELYRGCRLLVFPGEEDFGIVPLEAMACGRPVVAYARGGALETVAPGVSGVMFEEQTVESLNTAIAACAVTAWDADAIRQQALRFDEPRFMAGLEAEIGALITP